jgi:hypothetical protein
MEEGENRVRASCCGLLLALKSDMTVEVGVVLMEIARFGWLFGISWADDGNVGLDWLDSLGSCCAGKLNVIE